MKATSEKVTVADMKRPMSCLACDRGFRFDPKEKVIYRLTTTRPDGTPAVRYCCEKCLPQALEILERA